MNELTNSKGNLIPNTLNSGFICSANGMTIITNTKGGIYTLGKGEKKLVCTDVAEQINYYQDHIYYINNHDIYRIRIDGTGKELLIENCSQFVIENSILYFEQANKLQRVSLNLPNVVKPIIKRYEHISSFCVYESKIFYIADTKTIICTDLRGKKGVVAKGSHIIDFCVDSGKVYFADSNQKNEVKIYSVGIKSKEKALVMSIHSYWAHFIVIDEQIFYINLSDNHLYNLYPMIDEKIFPPLNYSDGYIYYFSHEELWALKRVNVKTLEVELMETDIKSLRLSNLAERSIGASSYPIVFNNKVYTFYDKSIYCMNEDGTAKRKIYEFKTQEDVEILKIMDIQNNNITFVYGNYYDFHGGVICADLTEQYDNELFPSILLDAVRYKDIIYFFENNHGLSSVDFHGRIEDLVEIEDGAEFGWMIRHEEIIYYCLNFSNEEHSIFSFNMADNSNEELTLRKKGMSSHSFKYDNGIYYNVLRAGKKFSDTKLIRFDLKTTGRIMIHSVGNVTRYLIGQDDIYYWSVKTENGLSPICKVSGDNAIEYPVNRAGHSYAPEVGKALIAQAKENL